MVYRLLKFLFSFAVRAYFRSISIRNIEHSRVTGPVIFVANHTSAFMDPIIIGMMIERPLFFLARGEAFKNVRVSKILARLNMIPIYRPEVTPEKVLENEAIFQKCYDHLAQGNCLIIFPEGFSKTERRLRKIKTGAARIALGTEEQKDFKLGLQILPIGINYSDPHKFGSDLFINIGNPIPVSEYRGQYIQRPFETARALTERIRKNLEMRTIVVHDESLDELIANVEKIYGDELRESTEPFDGKEGQSFLLSKEIVEIVTHFYNSDKPRVRRVNTMIDTYMKEIRDFNLSGSQLSKPGGSHASDFNLLTLILTLPIFIFGLINNYFPFKLTQLIAPKLVRREDFRGSLQLAIGLLFFLIFYLLQTMLVWAFFNGWIALLYFLLLYPSGLFALNYLKQVRMIRKRMRLRRLFSTKQDVAFRITQLRKAILEELEAARSEYASR